MVARHQQLRRLGSTFHRRRPDVPNKLVPRYIPTATYAGQATEITDTPPTPTDTTTQTTQAVTTTTPVAPPVIPTTTTQQPPPPLPTTTTESTTQQPQQQPLPSDTTSVIAPPVVDTTTTPLATPPPVVTTTSQKSTLSTLSTTSRSVAPAETSAVSAPDSSSSTNVGGIIGGLAGGLLGLIVIIFAIKFFLRRRSRSDDGAGTFNTNDFRRSAVLMNDPPTHEDTISAGFNPRPPVMVEQRLASPAPTFGTQYGAPGPHYYDNNSRPYGAADQYGHYQSFPPEQAMYNNSPPPSAMSANALFPAPVYSQTPFSPIGNPVYEHGHEDYGEPSPYLTRQPSAAGQLNRQPSYGQDSAQYANYPGPAYSAAPVTASTTDYVDLDRSSVTPFQAAQYAEISKKLNTDVPSGLATPAVNQYIQPSNLPIPEAGVSPFADPAMPFISQHRTSTGSQDLNFPAPPSPAYIDASRFRVDSTPPTLPEITVESRVSAMSGDFPNAIPGSAVPPSPIGSGYPSGATAAGSGNGLAIHGQHAQYPVTPSPLASSFAIDTPPIERTFQEVPPSPRVAAALKPEKRPETVYDTEDAYGGI